MLFITMSLESAKDIGSHSDAQQITSMYNKGILCILEVWKDKGVAWRKNQNKAQLRLTDKFNLSIQSQQTLQSLGKMNKSQ